MSRLAAALASALALCAALAASAAAHQGDARYRSIVRGVEPAVSGLRVQVLNYDDRFELDNRTGETVTIYGYNREPYARVDADGTVSVNRNSTAYYLNDERYANVPVPEAVREHPRAAPDWEVQDRTGRFEWHDHRMHWMVSGQVAPQVRDQSVRTKVFDYAVPIAVGGRRAAIAGTLWWVGEQGGSSFPIAAVVAFALVVLALGAAVAIVRRRRGGGPGAGDRDEREPSPAREAW